MANYGFGMTTDDIESKARLLAGYIGMEPISDPRAVALLAALPAAADRSAVGLRAIALGANADGIQRAISAAFDQVRPIDSTTPPKLKVPFYKNKKFWIGATIAIAIGGAFTGGVLVHRHYS